MKLGSGSQDSSRDSRQSDGPVDVVLPLIWTTSWSGCPGGTGVAEGAELGAIADVDSGLSFGLWRRIFSRRAVIGILGLGYVGLPLLQAFLTAGFSVVGFDISESRIRQIASGKISEPGVDASIFVDDAFAGNLDLSWEEECLSRADVFIICVPTPVTRNLVPDTSYISRACEAIRTHLEFDTEHLVVLEST